jgi:hypothetical protein
MTTIPERVNALITHSNGAQCDRCIQEQLGVAQNNQVQQITSALATTCEFVREKAVCAGCGKNKVVTRRVLLPAHLVAVAA